MAKRVLTREDLRKLRRPRILAVEAMGGIVHVRGLTSGEGDDWEYEQVQRGNQVKDLDQRQFTARYMLRTLCDEKGDLLFPPTGKDATGRPVWSQEQVEEVAGWPRAELNKLYHAATPLSGVTEAEIQELLGNSGGGPSDASGSASPSRSDAP